MRIIASIVAVFALSLSLPKIIGIGPSIITPPLLTFDSTFPIGGFSSGDLSESRLFLNRTYALEV